MKKKLFSLLLAAAMCLSFVPSALAATMSYDYKPITYTSGLAADNYFTFTFDQAATGYGLVTPAYVYPCIILKDSSTVTLDIPPARAELTDWCGDFSRGHLTDTNEVALATTKDSKVEYYFPIYDGVNPVSSLLNSENYLMRSNLYFGSRDEEYTSDNRSVIFFVLESQVDKLGSNLIYPGPRQFCTTKDFLSTGTPEIYFNESTATLYDNGITYEYIVRNNSKQDIDGNYLLVMFDPTKDFSYNYPKLQMVPYDLSLKPGESFTDTHVSDSWYLSTWEMLWIKFDSAAERKEFLSDSRLTYLNSYGFYSFRTGENGSSVSKCDSWFKEYLGVTLGVDH